ncbi:PIN domain-containing protein [Cyanobacterium aponinum FACHB-4101]|uniref:PIN domain-containing protein n=1 Tax=Cyanobacterium aponinum TaxID=379064 RepID=UPI0016805A76|nr:PIN domain-containing protein [Cyanobacterium aponinum]MBD2395851.1 PIN domain-containing protein [Cyanobacterium aponinum FACHB-4101]
MKDKYFFDTNVFIYALVESSNEKDIGKKQTALSWIENKEIEVIISSQVLNEVSNILLKKSKFTPVQIIETLEWMIDSLDVISLTPEISLTALDLHYRYQFSFYDSLIVSGAICSECEYLLTEDLQQGQVITYKSHLVKVVNPFA